MLAQIMNAQSAKKDHVVIPFSNMKFAIANILKKENFISEVERKAKKSKKSEHDYLYVTLRYDEDGQGAISGTQLVSRQSRRMYVGSKDIKPVRSGYGISVISTPKGVLSSKEARKMSVGGEILFNIF